MNNLPKVTQFMSEEKFLVHELKTSLWQNKIGQIILLLSTVVNIPRDQQNQVVVHLGTERIQQFSPS